jgi:hypothetical protein
MKGIFTTILLVSFFPVFAQDVNTKHQLQNLTKLDLGLRGIGFTFEPRLGNKLSMDLSAGLGGGYNISAGNFEYNWNFLQPAVYVIVNPKFYYNLDKRIEKGKKTGLNAGNYLGLVIKYTSKGLGENPDVWDALLFNLHWGIQRQVGKRWTFNTHAGIGYAVDATDLSNSSGTVYPALDLRFAYVFGKKAIGL